MSAIGASTPAAVAGASLQARVASEDKNKKANATRESRDVILDLHTTLSTDKKDGDHQELIDQELPNQGQATAAQQMPQQEDQQDEQEPDTDTAKQQPHQHPQATDPTAHSAFTQTMPKPLIKHIDLSA